MESNQKMMSIRFKEAFDYLKKNGVIKNQKDLADKLRTTPETVSRVIRCKNGCPSIEFMEKFARTYNEYFNESYIVNGVGKLIKTDDDNSIEILSNELRNQLNHKDKEINFLTDQIRIKDKQIEEQNETIKMLRNMLNQYTESKSLDKKAVANL